MKKISDFCPTGSMRLLYLSLRAFQAHLPVLKGGIGQVPSFIHSSRRDTAILHDSFNKKSWHLIFRSNASSDILVI